jgi:hypothetical protein
MVANSWSEGCSSIIQGILTGNSDLEEADADNSEVEGTASDIMHNALTANDMGVE